MSDKNNPCGDTPSRSDCLDEILAGYIRALELGQNPSRDELLTRHPDLTAELREFFADHDRMNRLAEPLGEPMRFHAATVDMPADVAAPLGTVIGPYKLLQQIGAGGMGVVYMAEQAAPVRRKVALKIIKPGMDTREVIARFEAERQALALMDHPNIARVFDAGETEAGRPYFVMELVRGVPLTDYCDQNNLPVHERLELFVTVCHAVQHAHQKGIIHRDIKPTNVLVTLHDSRPVPKVIDFGVAKAIGQELTDKTLFTQFAQMVGTPLYMSPEQAQLTGQDIDTRGDIYSLGVMLYELLTGTTPFERGRMKQAALEEIRRMIREEDPPAPSTRLSSTAGETRTAVAGHRRVDPKGLSRLVRGDLDWIVMKALEKDRNRRYETANGFAADIGRYLSDEPVEACPPSSAYRFRKFARRNRVAFSTAALVLAALVMGMVVSTWQAFRATHAEGLAEERLEMANTNYNTAEAQRQRAEASEADAKTKEELAQDARKEAVENLKDAVAAVDQMLARVAHERLLNVPQMEPLRKELMEDALKFYQKFLQKNNNDPLIGRETAGAYRRMGEIYAWIGRNAEAEEYYRKAFDMFEELENRSALEPSLRLDVITAHFEVALCYRDLERPADRERHARRAVELAEELMREFPSDPRYTEHFALAALQLSELLAPEEAERIFRRILTLEITPEKVGMCHQCFGQLLLGQGRSSEAVAMFRKAVEISETIAALESSARLAQWTLGDNLYLLANALTAQGQLQEAEGFNARAIVSLDKVAADYPTGPVYRFSQACAHEGRALVMRKMNRMAEAEQAWRRALDLFTMISAEFPNAIGAGQHVVDQHLDFGQFLEQLGRTEDALQVYRAAIGVEEKLIANDSRRLNKWHGLVRIHVELGRVLAKCGQAKEAEAAFRKALEIQETLERNFHDKPEDRRDLAQSHLHASELFVNTGRWEEAEKICRLAVASHATLSADFPNEPLLRQNLANCYNRLHAILVSKGRHDEAQAARRDRVVVLEKLLKDIEPTPKNWWILAYTHNDLAWTLRNDFKGRELQAEDEHRLALALIEQVIESSPTGPSHRTERSEINFAIATLMFARGDLAGARSFTERAAALAQTALQSENLDDSSRERLCRDLRQYADEFLRLKDPAAAEETLRRAYSDWETRVAESPQESVYRKEVPLGHAALVEILIQQGKHAEAGKVAVALQTAQYRAGNWIESVTAFERSAELGVRTDGFSSYYLAMTLWQLGEEELAQTAYDEGTKWIRQNEAELENDQARLVKLIRLKVEAGELLAATEPQGVLVRNRQRGVWAQRQGHLLAEQGRWEEAATAYSRAIELGSNDLDGVWLRLAMLRLKAGHTEEYRRLVSTALDRFGATDDLAVATNLGILAKLTPGASDDVVAVLKVLERALAGKPNDGLALAIRAHLLVRAGLAAEGVPILEGMVAATPDGQGDQRFNLLFLALGRQQLGRNKEALEAYRAAELWQDIRFNAWSQRIDFDRTCDELELLLMNREKLVRLIWFPRFSPDGKWLLTAHGSWDAKERGEARLFAVQDGAVKHMLKHPRGVRTVAWSSQSTFFVTGGYEGIVRFFDPLTGKQLFELNAGDNVENLRISAADELLITSHGSGDVRVYELPSRKELHHFKGVHQGGIWGMGISPNGKFVATAGNDSFVRIIDLDAHKIVREFRHPAKTHGVAFTPDSRHLATGCSDCLIRLFDVSTGEVLAQYKGDELGDIIDLQFNTDGKLLASAGKDGTVRLWDVSNLRQATLTKTLRGHTQHLFGVAISPDDRSVVSVGWDEQIKMWDLQTGEIRWTWKR